MKAGRFCVIHSPDDSFFDTDGLCTHEKVHLCGGLVMAHTVECPKHDGLFDYRTGEAVRAPALKSYSAKVQNGQVYVEV